MWRKGMRKLRNLSDEELAIPVLLTRHKRNSPQQWYSLACDHNMSRCFIVGYTLSHYLVWHNILYSICVATHLRNLAMESTSNY